MPKKFKGINSKAEEARARKAEVKSAENERKEREEEDKLWEDNDKHVLKKQQRKENRDQRKQEALGRKIAARELLEQEEKDLKGNKAAAADPVMKVTRAQISAQQEDKAVADKAQQKKEGEKTIHDERLEENPNQQMAELLAAEGAVEARSVQDAIATLAVDPQVERHPERRVKAAYSEFEERELPRLKKENPNLRLSQLKQMLRKDWMKSPENPLNAAHASYNAKR